MSVKGSLNNPFAYEIREKFNCWLSPHFNPSVNYIPLQLQLTGYILYKLENATEQNLDDALLWCLEHGFKYLEYSNTVDGIKLEDFHYSLTV